ncbi:1729_t:CDS:10 [Cetraspora pellucida]|uniref:1729_t:CDS:1 n=1 Tax=Cetraspora pellucida TaxID=1433469 RepID=A0ACA9K279_9GLOM|nr:1729_t:CDS:10 [Cetraspora pellucida]
MNSIPQLLENKKTPIVDFQIIGSKKLQPTILEIECDKENITTYLSDGHSVLRKATLTQLENTRVLPAKRDMDEYLIVENRIYEEITMACYRYAKANNLQCPNYEFSKLKFWILYEDMNNLYSDAMIQYMPTEILSKVSLEEVPDIQNIAPDTEIGYTLEVDLEALMHLHDYFADYPLVSEKQIISENWLSLYNEILVYDKNVGERKYTYMKFEIKVTKIHNALKFRQFLWMKEYIEENIRKCKIAKANRNEFEGKKYDNLAKNYEGYLKKLQAEKNLNDYIKTIAIKMFPNEEAYTLRLENYRKKYADNESDQIQYSNISLTIWTCFKEVFDQERNARNLTFDEMYNRIEEGYIKSKITNARIRAVFEFKKAVEDHYAYQAILEMISTDFYINDKIKVFSVLTDLKSSWNIYWIGNEKRVMTITFSYCTKVLNLIAQMVSDLNGTSKTVHMLGLPKIECIKVKQLYNDGVPNDNPMTDFYEEMNEDKRQRHEVRKAVILIKNTPIFLSIKENAEIPDLKKKLAEFESEKIELKVRFAEALKQAVKESERCDAENAELKVRIEELEKNKVDSSAKNIRCDDAIVELKAEVVKLRDDNERSNQVTFSLFCMSDQKILEDRKMDTFLDDAYKKSVSSGISNAIRRRNFCRAGLHNNHPDNSSEVSEFSDLKTKKEVENIMQDVFDFTVNESNKNHMAKFLLTGRKENSGVLKNIAYLYEDAYNAEDEMIKANQNLNTELLGDQNDSIINLKRIFQMIRLNASEAVSDKISKSTLSIPISYNFNSSGFVNVDGDNLNSIINDSDSDYSEKEMPDESDNNRYSRYGRYNEYGESDRGYYYDLSSRKKTYKNSDYIISTY